MQKKGANDAESIGTSGAVRCKIYLYPWKSAHQHFLLCDWVIASGHRRLRHLLYRSGNVDFAGHPCRHGIGGDPRNLPVGLGCCKI